MSGWGYLLLLCSTALQMGPLQGQQSSQSPPAELASRLLEDSCKADNFTAFYLHIREKQGMARKFPVWPAGKSI